MSEEVTLFVNACTICGCSKQPTGYIKTPQQHVVAHNFNDVLLIDHVEPEKALGCKSASGFKYVLTMTDLFSGYVIAVPTKTQQSEETIKHIFHSWVLRFGMMREIIDDNAPGFTSKFMAAVLKAFGCKETHGQPYRCASTSKVERANKRLNVALRLCLNDTQIKHWDKYLDYICFALNCLKCKHTGYSANKIVFGRELNTPLSLLIENTDKEEKHKTHDQKAYELHKTIKQIVQNVRKNAALDYMHADIYNNRNLYGPTFNEQDMCYILVQCPKHKYSKRFSGPFVVKKKISDHTYVIDLNDGTEVVKNISKMKHFKKNKYSEKYFRKLANKSKNQPELQQHISTNHSEKKMDAESMSSSDSDSEVEHNHEPLKVKKKSLDSGVPKKRKLPVIPVLLDSNETSTTKLKRTEVTVPNNNSSTDELEADTAEISGPRDADIDRARYPSRNRRRPSFYVA